MTRAPFFKNAWIHQIPKRWTALPVGTQPAAADTRRFDQITHPPHGLNSRGSPMQVSNESHGARRGKQAFFAVLGATTLAGTQSANAQGNPPEFVAISGTVRDFRADHPDFGIIPAGGYGHYAGNIEYTLGLNGKPVFSGSGFAVASQWLDSNSRPIAPHLFNYTGAGLWETSGVASGGSILMGQNAVIDSWDSSLGSYAATQGAQAVVATNGIGAGDVILGQDSQIRGDVFVGPGGDPNSVISGSGVSGTSASLGEAGEMPVLTEPAGMGPNVGNVMYNGMSVLSSNLHCNMLTLKLNAVLRIDGDITILVESLMKLSQNARIELLPGSSLTVYSKRAVNIHQGASINLNGDPSLITMNHMTGELFSMHQDAQIFGTVITPDAELALSQGADLYGRWVGDRIDMGQAAAVHIDLSLDDSQMVCGIEVLDTAGASGGFDTGGITSADSFGQWFNDVPGVNTSQKHSITLTLADDGLYEYLSDDLYPVDGRLYGNEGADHNYYFTYDIVGNFVFDACSNQVVQLQADDDVWLFINDQLVIDLGGMRAGTAQHIELDRLGLQDGQTYSFYLYHAQRQTDGATFNLRTNVRIRTDPDALALGSLVLYD